MPRRSILALALALASSVAACGPASTPSSATPRRAPELAIIDDDYARALAEARATQRPIVAVTGAVWCDSCREMRASVLTNPKLVPLARDFVWLAVDVERDDNAAFIARFASEAQPIVWVIDPATETAVVAWRGTVSATLLADLAHRAGDAIHGRDPGGDVSAALARAFRADASGETQRALDEYRFVIEHAPVDVARGFAVVATLALLGATPDPAACSTLATREAPALAATEFVASVVALGLECNPGSAPLVDAARRLATGNARMLAGDRSALFARIVADARRRSDDAAAVRDGRAWLAFLDAESRVASSPAARAALDGARITAHAALGEPDAAIPALAQSERDLPNDGGPPANLARAFALARHWDEALRAVDRAIALAHGPYRIALLARRVDIEVGVGDAHSALRTLDDALVLARSLPLTGAYARLRATLEIRRSEWRAR